MAPTLATCLARRENDLAAVRLLAAIAVLHAHAWVVTTRGLQTSDFFHVFGFSLDFHGVHAFFILSGMLLARSLIERPDPLRFVVARLVRYLPAIFVSTAIAALALGPLLTRLALAEYFAQGAPFLFILKVTSLLDINAPLPGVFDFGPQPTTLYVPLWTVHYELVFALALAALGALLKRRWLVLAALVATLAVNVVWFWNGEEHAHLGSPHHLVRFCSAFGIGIALAVFAERVPVSNRMLLAIAAVTIPLGFTPFAALAGMILLAYAILCVGFLGGRLTAALAKLGVWSYGFYVSGFVIEQTVAALGLPGGAWTVAAVSLPLALAAGALSWRYVERPTIARTSALASALRGGRKPAPRREATLTSVARD